MFVEERLSHLCVGQNGIDVVVGHGDDGDDLKPLYMTRKTRWVYGWGGAKSVYPTNHVHWKFWRFYH